MASKQNLNLVFILRVASINHLIMDSGNWHRDMSAYKHVHAFWVGDTFAHEDHKKCNDENF